MAQSSSAASLFAEEHDTPIPQVRYPNFFIDVELPATFHELIMVDLIEIFGVQRLILNE